MTIIRRATPEDALSLAEIHVASCQSAYRDILPDSVRKGFTVDKWVSKFQQMIAEETQVIALIKDKEKILGYTIIGPNRDEDLEDNCGEVWGLYISPDHWRKGLGTQLTKWACRQLKSRGYDIGTLWVFQTNLAAREFYQAMGFTSDRATKEVKPGAPLAVRYRKRMRHSNRYVETLVS
jgi:ribosomal protein S18 acetylase RimI-like enzyme